MSKKIRLVWDFYGELSDGTAKHHVKHLEEFMVKEKMDFYNKGTFSEAELHTLAFITVDEDNVVVLRDTLKPNRAFVEQIEQ